MQRTRSCRQRRRYMKLFDGVNGSQGHNKCSRTSAYKDIRLRQIEEVHSRRMVM